MGLPLGKKALVALLSLGLMVDLWIEFRQPHLPAGLRIVIVAAFLLLSTGAWIRLRAREGRKPLGAFVDSVFGLAWAVFMGMHVFPLIDKWRGER
jgi:hypothetical protein